MGNAQSSSSSPAVASATSSSSSSSAVGTTRFPPHTRFNKDGKPIDENGAVLKPCCVCPETKTQRDSCVLKNGEENCQDFIALHQECLRSYGFKTTTGLTGVPVHENPRPVLVSLYEKTLEQLQAIPESSPYRAATVSLTKQRLALVKNEQTPIENVEQAIGEGPIEMVIKQAEAELSLAQKMQEWQPWGKLETPAPVGQWDYAFKQK
ncbi:hypothetical protein RI367_002990 [Sorochytrium milnesiophthora]